MNWSLELLRQLMPEALLSAASAARALAGFIQNTRRNVTSELGARVAASVAKLTSASYIESTYTRIRPLYYFMAAT